MYTKPELIVMSNAVQAIQNSTIKGCTCADGAPPHQDNATSAAYEADE